MGINNIYSLKGSTFKKKEPKKNKKLIFFIYLYIDLSQP